jgi:hypothetical protein
MKVNCEIEIEMQGGRKGVEIMGCDFECRSDGGSLAKGWFFFFFFSLREVVNVHAL